MSDLKGYIRQMRAEAMWDARFNLSLTLANLADKNKLAKRVTLEEMQNPWYLYHKFLLKDLMLVAQYDYKD